MYFWYIDNLDKIKQNVCKIDEWNWIGIYEKLKASNSISRLFSINITDMYTFFRIQGQLVIKENSYKKSVFTAKDL